MNNDLFKYLNETVATYGLFYIKLHQHHFYVRGKGFFILHEKFEEMYDMMHEQFDELAERLITLGGKPYATLQEFIDHSIITEKPYEETTADELVASTVSDLKTFVKHLEKGIEMTGDTDNGTQDLLIGYQSSMEKEIWMLQAFLGKGPLDK